MDTWGQMNASGLYGLQAGATPDQSRGHTTPLAAIAGPGLHNSSAPPWHPQNPLFWAGALLAVTLGLAGFSVAGRVGPVKAGGEVGKA